MSIKNLTAAVLVAGALVLVPVSISPAGALETQSLCASDQCPAGWGMCIDDDGNFVPYSTPVVG